MTMENHLSEIPADFWCSDLAHTASEPAAGTAVLAETWLALEIPGGWMPKAFEDSDMPSDIKVHLEAALDRLPGGRIQFIKQSESRDRETRTLFIARSNGDRSLLYRLEFRDLAELLDLPFTREWLESLQPVDEPLYLVCTHGTRDRCCARYGMAVFDTLSEYRPGQVWQSSHLGGHRFAANVACLPEGLLYGYVAPDSVPALIDGYEAGVIDPTLLRGRSSFSKPAQAAEGFVWQAMGDQLNGPGQLTAADQIPGDPTGHRVVFQLNDERIVTVVLREREPVFENYVSCGTPRTKAVTHYDLKELSIS